MKAPWIAFMLLAPSLQLAACHSTEPANFVRWRDHLASAAQPDERWLERAGQSGYQVVVNLAPPQSHGSLPGEGGIVARQGITYVNIPVDFGAPTPEDFRLFSDVLKGSAGRNVFVHCQANLRASSFIALYRVIHEKAPLGETLALLAGVWAPDPVWKRFIESTFAAHGVRAEIL